MSITINTLGRNDVFFCNRLMNNRRLHFLFVILFFLSSFVFAGEQFVARIYYKDVSDYSKLHAFDVLEYNNRPEKYFLALVDNFSFERLKNEGWMVKKDASRSLLFQSSIQNFYSGYRTVDELYADMAAVTSAYPDITEIVDYGDGYCKSLGGVYTTPGGDTQKVYDLLAVKITNKNTTGDKPVFFLMAGIHAREITTPEVAMRMIDWLTQEYETNADASWIVDYQETWIVPSVNPEGHWIVELGDEQPYGSPYYQRKNANHDDGYTGWPPSGWGQYGVDLNRNHSYKWGLTGSSSEPSDLTYRGTSSNSEPEVDELQNLISSLIPDQRTEGQPAPDDTTGILISMHSYSELVLWPWGYTSSAAPNKNSLKKIGDKFATYNGYTSEQSSDLYPTAGDSTDWAYGELGIPAFTFELGTQFMPPYSEVPLAQWPENRPALIYAAKIAREPYKLVDGPDVSGISIAPGTGDTVEISANINDAQNGGNSISSAELYVNIPSWDSNSVAFQMQPVDGAFNSASENVKAFVPIIEFLSGTNVIYIRGKDFEGNYGPPTAAFADNIPEPFIFISFYLSFLIYYFRKR